MPGTTSARASVELLYIRHRPGILAFLKRLVQHNETAEDLCQETFVKALRGWERRMPLSNPTAWLYQIARHTAYDELRRRRYRRFVPLLDGGSLWSETSGPEEPIIEQEPLRRALAQLPPIYRVPLVLHSYSGYQLAEIATALGCSESAMKARLHRARAALREALTQASECG